MRSEGNALKNGEQTVGFSFMTMLQETFSFSQEHLAQNNLTTLGISHTVLTWLQLSFTFPLAKISIEGVALL
jgi:hypothetical protein